MNERDLNEMFDRIYKSASAVSSDCCYYHDNGHSKDHNSRLAWIIQVKRDFARLNDAVNKYDDSVNSL